MRFPELIRVRQHFEAVREPDVTAAVHRELARLELARSIKPGQSVALTAGSRGIANIALILRETTHFLRGLGADVFLVPAMGSHGGGIAEEQRGILESYGITESFIGAPIRASMDVVELGKNDFGVPVYLDREASRADHIGVVARVKPHTGFSGKIESGLCKMMAIGLGKHVGARAYHRALMRCPWEPFVRSIARVMIAKAPIRFALAIVENARDETAKIEAAPPNRIEALDERLLELAVAWLPRLPFDNADLLIVDEIGKEISGSGMDTNVIGRRPGTGDLDGAPAIRRIFVRRLSEKTHGNAAGIGMADFTTDRLVAEMDYEATVINCMTANRPESAATPVHYANDLRAIEAALNSVGLDDPAQARVQRVRNTLHIEELLVSRNYDLSQARCPLEVLGAAPLEFDEGGNLPALP